MKPKRVKPAAKAAVRRLKKIRGRVTDVKAASPRSFRFSRRVHALTSGFDFTDSDLAGILDVNKRTITRWRAQDARLSPQQIDRIAVLESILDLGKRVLGSENEVRLWLNSPVLALEGQKPIELIKTESGRRRIENVLLQIEAGVY
jgi:putative toxin-antitoxin system antitoxin component (TIGR02293 family)